MKHNTGRFLTVTFCDDIRLEMGNKMSFMGCYQGDLFVASMPVALPKLCVHATAWTPKDKPFHSLTVRISLDDVDLASIEVPISNPELAPRTIDETASRQGISAALAFSPFVIEKPATLRVMVTTEEGEIVGPRLLLKVAQAQEPVVLTAAEPQPAKYLTLKARPKKAKVATKH
jgi:hypothetical protein